MNKKKPRMSKTTTRRISQMKLSEMRMKKKMVEARNDLCNMTRYNYSES